MSNFESLFGRTSPVIASSPGRVNLMGEHTDYNGGYVLPTPITQRTVVQLAVSGGQSVRVFSTSADSVVRAFTLGEETPGQGWLDYVQGCTRLLREQGHHLGGFDALIHSEVPLGSGLSSSAALSVSLLRALRQAFALSLDDLQLALLGQRVENHFVGAQVGVMDPVACSLGQQGEALFLDTRSLEYRRVPLPADADLAVVHSGVSHEISGGEYNTRRA